jgi:HPt (histidine-containing phosphotransfer) domain-containing protein
MPLMDGYEATRLIRQQERFVRSSTDPEAGPTRVPIVAMTASAMAGDREKCLRSGMDDYVSKPFTRDQLVRVINKWLQRSTPTSETSTVESQSPAETITPERDNARQQSSSPIDPAAMETIQALEDSGAPGLVTRLVDVYLKSSPELVDAMRDAVASEDAETLERSAHSLKSSSATLGALELAELCKELEQIGREAATDRAAEVFASLEMEFDRVRRALSDQWQEIA